MTQVVNVHAAKTNLSRLLERAEAGEDIVIGRAGKPIARLVPYVPERTKRVFGEWEHARVAGGLPMHHRDPFARMLVAQAIVERLTIVTRDESIPRYPVPVIAA
jgi:prevent-host-death family protein